MLQPYQRLVHLLALAATLALGASCEAPRSSMLGYATLRSTYRAAFFVSDRTVAIRTVDPPGGALVVWQPRVEGGSVVFNAGVASSGGGGERVQCFRLDDPSLQPDWSERLYWREPGGARVRVTVVDRSDEARAVTARCVARLARN